MRPINSMIEFKQIIGRGTRIFEGKEYFTLLDYVNASRLFSDPEWDGEPIDEISEEDLKKIREGKKGPKPPLPPPPPPRGTLKIKLMEGKEAEIQHMVTTSFWTAEGKPISLQEFLNKIYGYLPELFKNEAELRKIWSDPRMRRAFLEKLARAGYDWGILKNLQSLVNAENSDLFDVLNYLAYSVKPISRVKRVHQAESKIFSDLNIEQKEFLQFVLEKYIQNGVDELDEEKLPILLNLKYSAIADAEENLGEIDKIRSLFLGFQKELYI